MNYHAIIVAGGTGTRMQSEVPKQFIKLDGKEILAHTIQKFYDAIPEINIIVCVHPDFLNQTKKMIENYFQNKDIAIVTGGDTRFQSVKNGLRTLNETIGLVAVHDAARPLVSKITIREAFLSAEKKGCGIPVIPVNDSIRQINGDSSISVNRKNYVLVQTPQCFNLTDLLAAYNCNFEDHFTDDASVWEKSGRQVFLTTGNYENIKITYPEDLLIAESLLKFPEHDHR